MKRLILTCVCLATIFMYVSDARAGLFDAEIVSMSLSGDVGGMHVEIQESPSMQSMGEVTNIGGGLYHIDSFFDVFTELRVDGGPFEPFLTGPVETHTIVPEPTSMALLMWIGLMALLGGRKLVYQRGRRAL